MRSSTSITVNLETFLRERTPAWETLDRLLAHGHIRRARLGARAVLRLGELYQATAADLEFARRRFPGDPVVERLEQLVLRARHVVYRERPRETSLRTFLTRAYWCAVREHRPALTAAALAMFGPAVIAAVWAAHDPGAAIGLVPAAYRAAASPHLHRLPTGVTTQAALASSIYTNNIQVTFLAFAGGVLLGAGTFALLAYNGLLLGTLAGLTMQAGTFSVFVRYVIPHGLLELSCITVSGAAGLSLAAGIVLPGTLPRVESLRRRARPAVMLVLGTAPWLVVAGCVEGFITPRGLPLAGALGVGLVLAALYWGLVAALGKPRTGHNATRLLARR